MGLQVAKERNQKKGIMKTRYRIMYNGEVYRVQEMAVRKFSLRFKRYWKDTIIEHFGMDGSWTCKLEKNEKQDAITAIEQRMLSNKEQHKHKLHIKKFKKENPSGWKKVWP